MRIILIILSLIAINITTAQDIEQISKWKSYPVPKNIDTLKEIFKMDIEVITFGKSNDITEQSKMNTGNAKKNEYYYLYTQNSEVMVTSKRPFNPKEDKILAELNNPINLYINPCSDYVFMKVDDGYLYGYDNGEFGGCLKWYGLNGNGVYLVSDQSTRQIIKCDNRIYASYGLSQSFTNAYITLDDGSIIEYLKNIENCSIIEIYKQNDKWLTKEYFNTYYQIEFMSLDSQNNIIVLNRNSLLKVNNDLSVDSLGNQFFWNNHFNPKSLLIDNNIIYVSFRNFVYKYDLISKSESILRRN